MIIAQLAQLFAPWHSLYGDSKVVAAITESTHVLALLFGGGLAVAADRTTLRVLRQGAEARAAQLAELHAVHRPVLMALSVSFLSGLALAAADVETFAASPVFWVKLSLVALLLVNGAFLNRTESRLQSAVVAAAPADGLWARLKLVSVLSILLWSSTLVAGVVLVNVA